jgi:ferredoxin
MLKRDELGRENCTACGLCALSCPAEAITMKAEERKKMEQLMRAKLPESSKKPTNAVEARQKKVRLCVGVWV